LGGRHKVTNKKKDGGRYQGWGGVGFFFSFFSYTDSSYRTGEHRHRGTGGTTDNTAKRNRKILLHPLGLDSFEEQGVTLFIERRNEVKR
jgi:hypothetical protein